MIRGSVNPRGLPAILLRVEGHDWPAIVDTGFNGFLELPLELQGRVHEHFSGRVRSRLANGQWIEENNFALIFPFDGESVRANATFAPVPEILVGTRLLRRHRLQIDFANCSLVIEKPA